MADIGARTPRRPGAPPPRPASGMRAAIPPALIDFASGRSVRAHALFGAQHKPDGAYAFTVWAPRARSVHVVGDWTASDGEPLSPMGHGVWSTRSPGAKLGQHYRYRIVGADGQAFEKSDPFAFAAEPSSGTSLLTDLRYAWGDDAWLAARGPATRLDRPMSIYEVHLGSWRRIPEEGNRPLLYREIADPLADWVLRLGFTHVELMPLLEHPYSPSWGYGVTSFFAATRRYGSPTDLMALVDRLHERGIGVILDWVPAHFALDPHGLASFDGAPLFEPEDPARRIHPTWKSGRFDYGRPEVRSFLLSSAMYWIETFHADGLRVDGVEAILYRDHGQAGGTNASHESAEGAAFLRELTSTLKLEHPDVLLVAEDASAWPGVTRAVEQGGLGFDLKWDLGFSHDMRRYLATDPLFRSQAQDVLTFRSVYAKEESFVLPLSHDDVAQRSLLEQVHGDPWQRLANLRLLYAMTFAQPGKKLLFMGNELAQPRAWHHDTSLDWHLANVPPHDGIARMVRDLNTLHRLEPALHLHDADPRGFEWIDGSNASMSVVAFARHGNDPRDALVCIFNCTPVPRTQYRVGVPHGGFWREIFNSDARDYGGSGHGNLGGIHSVPYPWHGRHHSVVVTLPPLGALFLKT